MNRLRRQHSLLLLFIAVFALGGWLALRASKADTAFTIPLAATEGDIVNAAKCEEASDTAQFIRLYGACDQPTGKYGNPWYGYSLNNFIVGVDDYRAAYRFKAQSSGALESIKYYVIFSTARAGYSSGDCGDLHVSMQTDSGPPDHYPSGEELGSYVIEEPCGPNEFGDKPIFPQHNLTPQVQLQKDQFYHVVFKNLDLNMDVNWVSIDGMYEYSGRTPRQQGATDMDLAVLTGTGADNWRENTKDAPIFEVKYANGTTQGQTYMEFDYESNENTDLNPGQAVRQRITPSKDNVIASAVRIRAGQSEWSNQEYPDSRGKVALKTSSGETLAESQFIPYQFSDGWSTLPFPAPITLVKGSTYFLEITAVDGTLMFIPMQKGAGYGFSESLQFTDGYVEFNKNGNWEPFLDDGKTASCMCHDISFYFE